MKQKVFTLLTLLVLCVTGASAADYVKAFQSIFNNSLTSRWTGFNVYVAKKNTASGAGLSITAKNGAATTTEGVVKVKSDSEVWIAVPASSAGTIYMWGKGNNKSFTCGTISLSYTDNTKITQQSSAFTSSDIDEGYIKLVAGGEIEFNKIEIILTSGTYSASTTTQTIQIASSGLSSFSSKTKGFDFAKAVKYLDTDDDLEAYKASAADASSVTLDAIDEAAADAGVVLKGTGSAFYAIPIKDDAATVTGNKLLATDGTSTVENAAVLSGGEFHPLNSGVIAAGKAYLPYANITGGNPFGGGGGAHALEIVFGNETTAIKAVEAKKVENGVFYNLAGQQVAQPSKGLYIVNGRKVIVK